MSSISVPEMAYDLNNWEVTGSTWPIVADQNLEYMWLRVYHFLLQFANQQIGNLPSFFTIIWIYVISNLATVVLGQPVMAPW